MPLLPRKIQRRRTVDVQLVLRGAFLTVTAFLFVFLISANPSLGAEFRPKILFLASYHPSFHSFFDQIDGFKTGLRERGIGEKDVVLDVEFLDSKRFPLDSREQTVLQQLATKFQKLPPYDLVVTADDTALKFAKKWRESLFKGAQLVFLGVNNVDLALKQDRLPDIVGVIEKRSLGATLGLASRLFPQAGEVHVIEDGTPTGLLNRRQLGDYLEQHPDLSVVRHSLARLTYEELFQRFATVPPRAPVFLNSTYRDAQDRSMAYGDFVAGLRQSFSGPIFTVQRHAIGAGALGGSVVSHFEQGRTAAGLAAKILNGADPATLRVITESPNVFTFDHQEVTRFQIAKTALPAEAVFINAPKSIVKDYAYWIGGGIFVLIVQTLLILGLVNNVRQRKSAELASRESAARFSAFFEHSPSVMYIKNRDHDLTYVNAKYLSFHGVKAEDVIGKRGGSSFDKKKRDKVEQLDRRVMDEEIMVGDTVTMTSKSGETGQFYVTKFPVYGADGNVIGIGGINTDVTEIYKREQELIIAKTEAEQAAEKARAADKSKSQFLANMSHEIRTPMNGILGMADLLVGTELSPQQQDFVDTLRESGKALLTLLNDILDLSKIEAGQITLSEQDFSVNDLINLTNGLWKIPAEKKGLSFSIESSVPPDLALRGDRDRLRQIINNLIGNALKFTSEGRVHFQISENQRDDDRVELSFEVRDTGIGITDDQKEVIFDSFTQADGSTTRQFGGTGLGLAICKHLAQLLGGDIGVTSEPETGSVFWFTVQMTLGESELGKTDTIQKNESGAEAAPKNRQLKILIAEDNHINQKVIPWMLAPLKCDLTIVENGLEAVAAVARTPFDLVLMDVQMPRMDGVAATREIRGLPGPIANIPIIAITAHAMRGDRAKYLEAGMTDYISKPIDQKNLLKIVAVHANVTAPDLDEIAAQSPLDITEVCDTPQETPSEDLNNLMNDLDNLLDGTRN